MNNLRFKMSGDTADLVRTLHPDLKKKIRAALQTIRNDPMSWKRLKNELEGLQSFRVGKFRVIYKVAAGKEIIEIVAVGPRKTIYEETFRLLKKKT